MVLGGFGSFWLVLGGFGWFRILVTTSFPEHSDETSCYSQKAYSMPLQTTFRTHSRTKSSSFASIFGKL